MISAETVLEIERLLAQGGLSQRKIAEMTGVSRTFVNFVHRGRLRKPLSARPRDEAAASSPQRCPGCGARVYMPCVACRVRAFLTQERKEQEARRSGPAHSGEA